MAVLVTRPHPDDEATAAALRARGFEVLLAPMLRFEPVAFHDDLDARYGAVVVTSANALRGIELKGHRLLELPLFAVGEHTASAARRAGFTHVMPASGDAAALRDLVLAQVKAKELKKASTLLYLAGADLARDLAAELGDRRPAGRHPHHLQDGSGGEPAARGMRRLRRQPDRGGAALFPPQRARLSGCGAGRWRRNIGVVDSAMLHLGLGGRRGPRGRGRAGHGGGDAG